MLAQLIAAVALVVLLVVAYLHPRGRVEAAAGLLAAGAVVAVGGISWHGVVVELRRLGPVVGYLIAILVVAGSCRSNGIFDALGARLGRARSREHLFAATFVTAAVVTVALSLDATVVLLTPVVLVATRRPFVAGQLACVRLANSASLLLPVANLTNLLALAHSSVTFGRFAELVAPSWLVVLVIEYVALRLARRAEFADSMDADTTSEPAPPERPRWFPAAVVVLMLAGFVLTSPLGLAPVWVAAAAAIVLTGHDLVLRLSTPRALVDNAHVPFAVYVLGLGVVVAGLGNGWLGRHLDTLVPDGHSLPVLLAIAAIGAVLANVVNNLPATLLLAPLVAPSGVVALLALLIGINVGSTLTWTGSLANLLWRRVLHRYDEAVPSRAFHATALCVVPVAVVAAVCVLDGWTRWLG